MPPRALTALLLLCVLAASPLVTMAADDPRIAAVTAAERARFEANVKADAQALQRLLAADLEYVHSNGELDSRQSFIDSLTSGKRDYVSAVPSIESVRIHGDTATIRGKAKVTVADAGTARDLHIGYTDVWVWRDGRWQMTAWRSARLPDSPSARSEQSAPEASVRAAHLARFDSVVSNDLPRLESLLADDLDYCHSNGVCESKREYIGSLRSGQMKYQSIDPTIQSVKMLDDVALLLGHANVKATRDGVERSIRIGYTCVFALRDGRWQLTSWRSITLPDTQAG